MNTGSQTEITQEIIKISKSLKGTSLEYMLNALIWLHKNIGKSIPNNIEKNEVFRNRTAHKIIEDAYFSGCTDYALVFIVLCRAVGIEAVYVEAIRSSWLDEGGRLIQGHIFVECLINGSWVQVDPQRARIHALANYNGF